MSRGKRGAQSNVLKAIGLGDGRAGGQTSRDPRSGQTAKCRCGAVLEFSTAEFGQSIERCSDRDCINRRWHRPIADATPPSKAKSRHGVGTRRRRRSA